MRTLRELFCLPLLLVNFGIKKEEGLGKGLQREKKRKDREWSGNSTCTGPPLFVSFLKHVESTKSSGDAKQETDNNGAENGDLSMTPDLKNK